MVAISRRNRWHPRHGGFIRKLPHNLLTLGKCIVCISALLWLLGRPLGRNSPQELARELEEKDTPALQHPPQTRIITEKELWEEASKAYHRGLQAGREESRNKNHTRESTANSQVDGVDKTLSSVDAVPRKTADPNSSSSDPSHSPCSSVPLREPCPSYPAIPSSKPHLGRRRPGECVGPRGSVWDERGFNYFPNRDMFFPYEEEDSSFRSLVIFTAGRSAMENIDNLVRSWGFEHFDYVLMHYDDSSSEWNRFDWYKHAVAITGQQQAKFWFYKRFATPWLVRGYRYVHFVDSDAGSPPSRPFNLTQYENFLSDHGLLIAQPAIIKAGRSSDHDVCREHNDTLYRVTSVVENGPLYSVSQEAYACYWEMIDADAVSGWGPDACWCQYLHEVCGYPVESVCSVIDVFPIEHLNGKTASESSYRGKKYYEYGFKEWERYGKRMDKLLRSPFQRSAAQFRTFRSLPLPAERWVDGVSKPVIDVRERRKMQEEARRAKDARLLAQNRKQAIRRS